MPEPTGRRTVNRYLARLAIAAPFAAFGLLVATLTQAVTGSVRGGTLAGLAATVLAVLACAAWRRRTR